MYLGSWTGRFAKSLPLSTRQESIHNLEHAQRTDDDREGIENHVR